MVIWLYTIICLKDIDEMPKIYDYNSYSKISVVMERIATARERVWVNAAVGREYSASNVSCKVIDSAGSGCRYLCRLHLRIINTYSWIAINGWAGVASTNSNVDIVCALLPLLASASVLSIRQFIVLFLLEIAFSNWQ